MRKEKGLKRIYRYASNGLSYILFKMSKKINPNTITILGFITFMANWVFYLFVFLLGEITFLNKVIFVAILHIVLVIDFTDGDYAGRINRRTKLGHYLDGVLDFAKILFTYLLFYFISNKFDKLLIFLSLIVLAFFLWSKSNLYRENLVKKSSKEGKFLTISLLFGFSLVHQYLYLSIFLIFGFWQILILQILMGLLLTLKNFLKIIKYAKKFDQTKLNNTTSSEIIQD
ncbi:MAG: CDP-alcohol phosphatidyltransferase family protein [Promethearchaeota archaeon]